MNFDRFFASGHGVILAGQIPFSEQSTAAEPILAMGRKTGWPVFADALSGLRGCPGVIQHADLLLQQPPGAPAERLLHIGEGSVSKRLSQWLRPLREENYWQVRDRSKKRDPLFQDPVVFSASLEDFSRRLPERAGWAPAWQAADAAVERLCRQEIDGSLSEPAVARIVARQAARAGGLFLGNSMPVRDFDAFGCPPSPLPALGNRGASGIDGNIATAAGAAFHLGRPVVALLGDLTALHDLNSLALLRAAPVVVVIVNNSGGGIFRFLPLPVPEPDLQTYWETPHTMDFQAAAAQFGLPWRRASTPADLEQSLAEAIRVGSSAILEVVTDRAENLALHRTFAERVKILPLWQTPV